MPTDYHRVGRRGNQSSPPRRAPVAPAVRVSRSNVPPSRRLSRSRSPLLRLHHERMQKEEREKAERGFYDTYNREHLSRERERRRRSRSPVVKSRVMPGPQTASKQFRMEGHSRPRSRSREHRHDDHGRHMKSANKRSSPNSSSVFGDLNRVVKKAREMKELITVKEEKWGHSGFKELYPGDKRGSPPQKQRHHRSRSRSPPRKPLRKENDRGRSPRRLLPPRRPSPHRDSSSLNIAATKRSSPLRGGGAKGSASMGKIPTKNDDKMKRSSEIGSHLKQKRDEPLSRGRPSSAIGQKPSEKSGGVSSVLKQNRAKTVSTGLQQQKSSNSSRPNSSKDSKLPVHGNDRRRTNHSSSSEFSSRTPSPQLKKKSEQKDQQRKVPQSTKRRSSSSDSSSDDDVLEIHAGDRAPSLSRSGNSTSEDDSDSDESVRKGNERSPISSNLSDDISDVEKRSGKGTTGTGRPSSVKASESNGKPAEKDQPVALSSLSAKSVATVKKTPPVVGKGTTTATKPKGSATESESESSSSEEEPRMTLSERFAKLTQMSRDKREFAKPEISISEIDTKLKVVKDLRSSDTKVYVNQPQRPVSARSRPKTPDFKEGDMRYSSDDRRRHFERMTRDEPMERDRPEDWSDVRVRYKYYKSRGYFDERPLTLEEYTKWEVWWYEYRDWLAEEGYYDNQQPPPNDYLEAPTSGRGDMRRDSKNWRQKSDHLPPLFNNGRENRVRNFHSQPLPPPEPLLAHPIRLDGRGYPEEESNRIPISRRIGHTPGGSLMVSIPPGQGTGRSRLAGRLGFRR